MRKLKKKSSLRRLVLSGWKSGSSVSGKAGWHAVHTLKMSVQNPRPKSSSVRILDAGCINVAADFADFLDVD